MSSGKYVNAEEVARVKELNGRYPYMSTKDLADVMERSTTTISAILRGDYDEPLPQEEQAATLFDYQKAEAVDAIGAKLDETNALLARIAAALDKEEK